MSATAEAVAQAMREEFARQREADRDPAQRSREVMRGWFRERAATKEAVNTAKLARLFPSTHKPRVGGTVADEDGTRHTITAVAEGVVTLDNGETVAAADLAPPPAPKRENLTREQINERMNAAIRGTTE